MLHNPHLMRRPELADSKAVEVVPSAGGDQSAVVFEAFRATGDRWSVRYRHPLSAYQAFNVAIAVLHNQSTQLLDLLAPLDEEIRAAEPQLGTSAWAEPQQLLRRRPQPPQARHNL